MRVAEELRKGWAAMPDSIDLLAAFIGYGIMGLVVGTVLFHWFVLLESWIGCRRQHNARLKTQDAQTDALMGH